MGEVWHPVWHLVWHTHPPPRRGGVRSRPYVSLLEGSPARCLTHSSAPSWSSAASVPRAPGRGRACSPRPTPWPSSSATTRRTCTRRSSPGTTSRPAWPCSSRANFSSARRGSGSPGWASVSGVLLQGLGSRARIRWVDLVTRPIRTPCGSAASARPRRPSPSIAPVPCGAHA